jgi:hypothetical protein
VPAAAAAGPNRTIELLADQRPPILAGDGGAVRFYTAAGYRERGILLGTEPGRVAPYASLSGGPGGSGGVVPGVTGASGVPVCVPAICFSMKS